MTSDDLPRQAWDRQSTFGKWDLKRHGAGFGFGFGRRGSFCEGFNTSQVKKRLFEPFI
jgi:hypothetical protein